MHKSGVPHYMYSQTTVLCSADYIDVSATLYYLLDYGFSRAIKYICSDLIFVKNIFEDILFTSTTGTCTKVGTRTCMLISGDSGLN